MRRLDESHSGAYLRGVEASAHSSQSALTASTKHARQRRRPPSLPEQRNRTQRIAPWADTWKQLKASGRWS